MPVTRLAGPFGKWTTSQSSLILSRTPGMPARTVGNMATLPADQAPPGPPTVLRKLAAAGQDGRHVDGPPVVVDRGAVDGDVLLVEAGLVAALALGVDGQSSGDLLEVLPGPVVGGRVELPGQVDAGVLDHLLVDEENHDVAAAGEHVQLALDHAEVEE